jgi:hypothetical protein
VNVKIATTEIRFEAVRVHRPSGSALAESGTPTLRTNASTGANREGESHSCHGRNGSATRTAAASTIASTAQLKITP